MKRLGTVLHTARNGYIVAKLEQNELDRLPPLNVPVYDRDMRRIGTLLDIIGPVKSPYVIVKPASKEIKVYEGEPLYYKIPRPAKRKTRKTQHRRRGSSRGQRHAGPSGRKKSSQPRGRARREKGKRRGARR